MRVNTCYLEGKPTGVIQFDIDDYDIDKSNAIKAMLIKDLPSLHYAFVSPSGGLKFGVFTDFTGDREEFIQAYSYVKEKLLEVVGAVKFDKRMKSIYYLCYFSYDPDAYYSDTPERMPVSDSVRELILQQENVPTPDSTPVKPSTSATDQDKIVYLKAIDAIAGQINQIFGAGQKKDRIKLCNAIVSVFGYEQGVGLILNTLGFFKGDAGYLKSIVDLDNSFTGGTILHYARQVGFKGVTETFKQNNKAGDTERAVLIPKETSRIKRYSATEATSLIKETVDQFLNDQINVQLIVEMGVGKTWITLKKLIEYMDNRDPDADPLKVAMFVPSHKLGNDSLANLLGFEDDQVVGDGFSLGSKRFHKVIGGYGLHCQKLKHIPKDDSNSRTSRERSNSVSA